MKDLNGIPFRRRKKDEDPSILAIQLSQLTQQISNGTGGSGGVLVYNTLIDLQNAFPNGSTQPAWIIADNEWYYWSGTITKPTDNIAPVITCSSSGGTFSSAQTVTLSSNENATIYYTLDGSTPTTSSSIYSSALTIPSTSTLKFFGKDTSGNSSIVQSVIFTINAVDNTSPIISASVQGGTYTGVQTIVLSANETSTIYYTTDGSTPTYPVSGTTQTYSSALNISATTTLKYIGRDSAGNVSLPVTQTYTINIPVDTTPPVVTATPVAGTYTSAQSVTLSTEAGATIYYTTDGSTPTMASTVYTAPIPISATTTLQFIGKDVTGNVSTPVVATYTINIASGYVSNGLQVYYDFRPLTSLPSTMIDSSGNGNTGTFVGSGNTLSNGEFISSNTSSNYISFNNGISLMEAYPFTMEFYVNFTRVATGTWQTILDSKSATGSGYGVQLGYYNSTYSTSPNTLGMVGSVSQPNNLYSGFNAFDGNYHHITVAWQQTKQELYIDGVLVQTYNSTSANPLGTRAIQILGNSKAKIFRLYNRVLTASEVSQNYNEAIS
jgi:hypothetical protein